MPGFDAQAAVPAEREDVQEIARRARYGRVLFAFYLLLYVAFVLLNAFAPAVMASTPLAGINLSVTYGLALIAVAFLLALLYDWLCRKRVDGVSTTGGKR